MVLMEMLKVNQSKYLLSHLFATLQSFVHKFPALLYQGSTMYCASLCDQVLKCCSSPIIETRTTASAFLYLLMRFVRVSLSCLQVIFLCMKADWIMDGRKNYQDKDSGSGFSRVKVQATIALSSLINTKKFSTDVFLRKALATIIRYSLCAVIKRVVLFDRVFGTQLRTNGC